MREAAMTQPSVGRIVHYVNVPGQHESRCMAAIVTRVDPLDLERVGLVAFGDTNMYFAPLLPVGRGAQPKEHTGGVWYDGSERPAGGSWHWPERV